MNDFNDATRTTQHGLCRVRGSATLSHSSHASAFIIMGIESSVNHCTEPVRPESATPPLAYSDGIYRVWIVWGSYYLRNSLRPS